MLKNFNTERLIENLHGFVDTKVEIFKLEVREELSQSIVKVAIITVLALIFFMFALMASIGLAFWLNDLFSSPYIGFFCLALLYIGLFIIILLLNKAGVFGKLLEKWISQH